MGFSMRLACILVFLLSAVLHGATPVVTTVEVTARVPIVTEVEGPEEVELSPGEEARIPVRVAANVPWVLGVHSPNPWALVSKMFTGPAGGALANSREVTIRCSRDASGRQTIHLVYTLMPR